MNTQTLWIIAGLAAVLLWLYMRSPATVTATATPAAPDPTPTYVDPLLAMAGTLTPTPPAYQPPAVPPRAPSHNPPAIGLPTQPIRQATLTRLQQVSDQTLIGY